MPYWCTGRYKGIESINSHGFIQSQVHANVCVRPKNINDKPEAARIKGNALPQQALRELPRLAADLYTLQCCNCVAKYPIFWMRFSQLKGSIKVVNPLGTRVCFILRNIWAQLCCMKRINTVWQFDNFGLVSIKLQLILVKQCFKCGKRFFGISQAHKAKLHIINKPNTALNVALIIHSAVNRR